ncbi:MAG: 16S rRNA (cytidine(1402)-2'-O)-methyltransferase [Pelolinea sp.]|jgi:16S rRNA (cytidine1402-2'-O)-methyltransferase|nr:16S rRNA (cytidine(1402)-2'-O)-methyltransferase [Pelolinea sp.]
MQSGILYIVATPIGNPQDITLRALEILKSADRIICEERRIGSTILRQLKIGEKPLVELNEHNEEQQAQELAMALLNGETMALISDCGTPAFADPGALLVQLALDYEIKIVPVPGASSLMTLLSVSPAPLKEFYFAGFLPRKEDERRRRLDQLRKLRVPVVLMDTPYRLERMLQDVQSAFGKGRMITLGLNLTLPNEKILHQPVGEIIRQLKGQKSEFILIVH